MMSDLKRIHTKAELKQLAQELGVRPDWHEPDEQGLDAFVYGGSFDNCGNWGLQHFADRGYHAMLCLWNPQKEIGAGTIGDFERFIEMFVVLYKDDKAIAEINLATLFAFACDTDT